uniref:Uncharacterized protein n=1 Tax=Rhizophora mucronata TaxID=61149 RepID=A0A2P2QQ82_RHIMU
MGKVMNLIEESKVYNNLGPL